MKRFDSDRPEFSPYGFTCERWTPAGMPRPDRHNEIEVNLLGAGALTYLFGGHRTTIEAGKFAVFWAAIPHQIVGFDGEEPYFVLTWPLGQFLASGLELNVVSRILHGELLVETATDDGDQRRFREWERDLRDRDPIGEHAARLEVQARLLRFAKRVSNRPALSNGRGRSYPYAANSRPPQRWQLALSPIGRRQRGAPTDAYERPACVT